MPDAGDAREGKSWPCALAELARQTGRKTARVSETRARRTLWEKRRHQQQALLAAHGGIQEEAASELSPQGRAESPVSGVSVKKKGKGTAQSRV